MQYGSQCPRVEHSSGLFAAETTSLNNLSSSPSDCLSKIICIFMRCLEEAIINDVSVLLEN
jgi:hypothetical protein